MEYKDPVNAVDAFDNNDGTIFQGRLLHILAAESKRDNKLDEFAISKLPLKKQRELKRKSEAGSGFNWNSLYFSVCILVIASIAPLLTYPVRRRYERCGKPTRRQQS